MNNKSFAFAIISLIILIAVVSYAYVYFYKKSLSQNHTRPIPGFVGIKKPTPEQVRQQEGRAEPIITPELQKQFDSVKIGAIVSPNQEEILRQAMAAVKSVGTVQSTSSTGKIISVKKTTMSPEEMAKAMAAVKN